MDEPARFRQSGNAATPRTTSGDDGVTGRIHALREALADHPYLRHAMVVPTAGDLPVRAQKAILERGIDPLGVRGVYAGDQSYLVAANLQSVEQGITTALHEAVGHEGVRAVLGDRFEPVMETLYDTFPRQHDAWTTTAMRYGYVDTGTPAGRVEFAEELTAHLAEANVEVGELAMVRAEVRSRIREDFPSLPFTDADARALIQRSRESLILRHGDPDAAAEVRQRQERRSIATGRVINYSAAKGVGLPDALSLALHRDGSQVLDKDGIPCRLYHGTGQEIDRVEGTFWGTVDPALANEYGELRASMDEPAAVIPYYANIRRPFDGDALKAETSSPTIVTFARQLIRQAGLTGADAEAIKAQAGHLIDMADREESGPHYAPHDFWYRTRSAFGRDGAEAIAAMYEAAGFDGVRYTELGHLTYGAFSPAQLHFLDQGASPKGWQPDRQHGDGLMTERPDFQQWFHGSQAATSAGAPVVLYHGTQTSIEHDLRAGKPLYLTDSPAYANYYAAGESGASPQSFQANPTYTAGDLLPEKQEALVSRAERDYLDAQGLVSDDDLAFYSDHKAAPVLALWDALNAEEQAQAEQRTPGTRALVERFQDIEARMEQSSRQSFAALDTLREVGRKARIATPNVVPVYASIQAPYRVENEMEMCLLTDDPGSVERLKTQGYDSAIWINPGVEHLGEARGLPYGSEVLVFSPAEQIRSVYAANTPTRQAGDVRFSLGGAPEYRLSLSSAMDEVSILRPRVEAAYGEGRLEEAERLDARLETLYQRLEDGYLAMEEDGPASDEPWLSRHLLESAGDVTDDEASFEQDFGNRYHALFYGHEGDFMDTADKVATLRGVAEDYGALYGGLRKDVTDNDILDAATEAYRDQVARHQRPGTTSAGGHDALTMAKLAQRAGLDATLIHQQTGCTDVVNKAGDSLAYHGVAARQESPITAKPNTMWRVDLLHEEGPGTLMPGPSGTQHGALESGETQACRPRLMDMDNGKFDNHTQAGRRLEAFSHNVIDLIESEDVLDLLEGTGMACSWLDGGSRMFAEALNEWSGGEIAMGVTVTAEGKASTAFGVLSTGEGASAVTVLVDAAGVMLPDMLPEKLEKIGYRGNEKMLSGHQAEDMAADLPMDEHTMGMLVRVLATAVGDYDAWADSLQRDIRQEPSMRANFAQSAPQHAPTIEHDSSSPIASPTAG